MIVNRREISRRTFLRVSGAAALGLAATACAKTTTAPPEVATATSAPAQPTATSAPAQPTATPEPEVVQEAPELNEMVGSGQLPALDERLGSEPQVLVREGFDQQIGTYGGEMNLISSMQTLEAMLMLSPDGTTTIPCIAKAWEYDDDGKTFRLHLRRGANWSDGEPFTADDITFWWEALCLNTDLTPSGPTKWTFDGESMEVRKVDDFTVEWRFPVVVYHVPDRINTTKGAGGQNSGAGRSTHLPKHYLEQFHTAYNDEAEALAKAADYETWYEHFAYRANTIPIVPDTPAMTPWIVTEMTATGNTWKRNPYYFKVDPEGNQLPYVNGVSQPPRPDPEAYLILMMGGQVDYEAWNTRIQDYPVLKENEDQGGYNVWLGTNVRGAGAYFGFNQTYEADPELGEIFANRDFRHAMSLAINRDEINQKLMLGEGMPVQVTAYIGCSWYKEEWGQSYVEFDPDRAGGLLDDIGLNVRDAEGFRTKPSGDELAVILEVEAVRAPFAELVTAHWNAIGVRTIMTAVDRSTIWPKLGANEMQCMVWGLDSMIESNLVSGRAGYDAMSVWGVRWLQWLQSGGEQGVEPPDDVKHIYDLCMSIDSTPPDKVAAVMQEIFDWEAENLGRIGTVGYEGKPCVATKTLGNIDQTAFADAFDVGSTRNQWLELVYWET
jgi:peptide/nickel transport system substrate-binding protein